MFKETKDKPGNTGRKLKSDLAYLKNKQIELLEIIQ